MRNGPLEAHRNQVGALRELVLCAGYSVTLEEVEDALSFNNGDEEMTYEYLMLLHADKVNGENKHDIQKTTVEDTDVSPMDMSGERVDELTAEEASFRW